MMNGHRANRRVKTTNAISCVAAMDIVFLIDYTGSMGGSINGVKAAIASLLATIEEESNNDYRLSLILFDENLPANASYNYTGKPFYQSLPTDQRIVNGNILITVLNKLQQNNYADTIQKLNKINTEECPLGSGYGIPEPSDYALKLVLNNNIAGAFRTGVNKSVIIFTDAPPSGLNDAYTVEEDLVEMLGLASACRDNGITLSVSDINSNGNVDNIYVVSSAITGGVYQTGNGIQVLQSLIVNTCDNIAEILPVVTTNSVTSVTNSGFTVNGTVTSQGSSAIIERGFLYSQSNITLIEGASGVIKSVSGSGTGNFSANVSVSLSSGQTYYVRAYCKNSNNIAYGNKFRASMVAVTAPVVTMTSLAYSDKLNLKGTIQSDGGQTLTERGFVYSSTNTNPFIGGASVTKVIVPGLFSVFSADVVAPSGTYYAKAYAINSQGTAYSAVMNNLAGSNLSIDFGAEINGITGSLTVTINGTSTVYNTTTSISITVPLDSIISVALSITGSGSTSIIRTLLVLNSGGVIYDQSSMSNQFTTFTIGLSAYVSAGFSN